MNEVPPYPTAAQVGRACCMTTIRAKRMLQRAGIAEKLGTHWVVNWTTLRERLPEVARRVFDYFVLSDRNDHRRSETITGDR
jgi:hypothetical protein